MLGMEAADAKKKAGAPCTTRNIQKRGNALIAGGQQRAAKKAKAKPPKRKKPYRLCVLWLEVPGRFESSIESTNHVSVLSHVSASMRVGFLRIHYSLWFI